MSQTYRITFQLGPRAEVDVTVPDGVDTLDYLANEIARELGLMRFEIQIGNAGGRIRRIGDNTPGVAFTLTQTTTKD